MDAPVSEQDSNPRLSHGKLIDYDLLARMVIREGKPFNVSALMAGYSHAVATRGLKALVEESRPVAEAIRKETERQMVTLERVKPLAVARLVHEITDYESPLGMRAIELAGRFKETDWFVRNADVNLGVFLNMTDQTPDTNPPDTFKE